MRKTMLFASAMFVFGVALVSSAMAQSPDPRQAGQPPTGQPPTGQSPPGPPQASPPVIILPGQHPSPSPGQSAPQAQSQPLPSSGDVLLSFSGTATQPVQAVAVGPDTEMLTIGLYMTSTNGVGQDFMNAMAGMCSGSAFLNADAGKIEASGFCDYADADGDQVFEHFVIPPQSQDNPLAAQGQWTGGTGKYEGLRGAFALAGIVLPTVNNDVIQIAGQKRGRYVLARAQVQAPPPSAPTTGSSQPPGNPSALPTPPSGSSSPGSPQQPGGAAPPPSGGQPPASPQKP